MLYINENTLKNYSLFAQFFFDTSTPGAVTLKVLQIYCKVTSNIVSKFDIQVWGQRLPPLSIYYFVSARKDVIVDAKVLFIYLTYINNKNMLIIKLSI